MFDIGAGTGRDAAWLAAKGHEVVAIEPSNAMRRHGQQLHQRDHIRWVDDRLPSLATTLRLGLAADIILLSGVWQHLPPADRPRVASRTPAREKCKLMCRTNCRYFLQECVYVVLRLLKLPDV